MAFISFLARLCLPCRAGQTRQRQASSRLAHPPRVEDFPISCVKAKVESLFLGRSPDRLVAF